MCIPKDKNYGKQNKRKKIRRVNVKTKQKQQKKNYNRVSTITATERAPSGLLWRD